tara:strand:+ start:4584 stop:5261 length:678 start_codon:yes stop_codon:yes gene_type:complete
MLPNPGAKPGWSLENHVFVIDMASLEKVGEFGSKAWGEACAAAAVRILEAADLPQNFEWAFTECYTHPPARLLEGDREKAGYYIMVKDGTISGGDGEPEEALAIRGFHIRARWAAICNQSGAFYGREGFGKRREGEAALRAAIEKHVGRKDPYGEAMPSPFYWPDTVSTPLMAGSEVGNGLHNIAAAMQIPSPEFADLPVTEMLVPDFERMTDAQKADFIKLLRL